uniref:Uncharacterized protein AlNc14C10G1294 n=1 Tax=Albugo laibachii Nc14 TaxID=890382 RepID=F0W2Q6_9STRA|nr:hypothetical protein OsJ_12383 [Albugo laibachii Nc14]|eukprot:CCA15342.1 hypothetical protein OsJ_12383 [Albugo laibachii Nc14]
MENEVLDQFLETIINHSTNTAAVESYKDHILENLTQNLLSSELLGNKIVDAVFRCHNRQSVKHLRELLINVITRVDGVTDTIASVFISRFNEIAHSFASCRTVALDLSCELLKVCKMDQTSPASWQMDFLNGQVIVLESTLDDKARQQMHCRQKIANLLQIRPALVPSYLTVIENAKNDDQFYVLLRAILSTQKNLDTETQRKLLESYVYWSFESKTRRFPARISQKDLKLEWITKQQFDTIIRPVMEKLLKKSPDTILEATLACVRACSLDFSPYLESVFLPLLTTKLRSQNNIVRSLCVELAAALLPSSNSVDSRFLLVSEICRLLEGKYGLLAHFYQREAVYLALLNTITVLKGGNYSKESIVVMCDTLIPIVLQAVEKEAHKATRYLGLETFGELSALGQQIPDALVSYMKKGMKDVKAEEQVIGCIYVLLVLLAQMKNHSTSDTNLIKPLTSFTKDLDRIACDGNLKSKSSYSRILAIATMGAIATKSASADAEVVQTQSWKLFSDPNSFIAPSIRHVLTRLNSREPSEDTKLEAQSLQQSAVAISHFLACNQQLYHHLYALLVDLLCCKDISVRQRTESCIMSMYDRGQTKHVIGLMEGLVQKVTGVDSTASRSSSSVWRHALRVIVPKVRNELAEDTRAEIFAPVLFVSHHPLLMSGKSLKHYGKEWEHICKRFVCSSGDLPAEDSEGIRDGIDRIIENESGVQESILNMLVKNSSEIVSEYENFLFSSNEMDRLSAQRVIVTLLQFAGSGEGEDIALRQVLQDLILRQIDWERIFQITEEDAAIYSTPFDQLYVATKEQDQSSAVGSSRRKASRQGNEDEQWEQQVRHELERKKRETQTTTSYTAEEKLQLDAQQKIRVHLKSLETRITHLSEIIQFVAKSAPEEFHPAIPYVFQKAATLFESKLYSKYAHEITFALAKSISPILLRAHAEDIANSVRLVLHHGNASSSHITINTLIETDGPILRALRALMDYCFGVHFSSEDDFEADLPLNYVPPPSFHLIFPILRTLLHTNNSLRHWTLPIFAIHARMIPEEEEEDVGDALAQRLLRKEMIELAINLLFHIAVKEANISNDDLHPAKILSNICTTPTLTPEEWKPILGDQGLLSEHSVVREACLYAIMQMMQAEESVAAIQSDPMLTCRLFMTRFDPSDVCQGIAKRIWDESHLELSDQFGDHILQLLSHSQECVRESAASAIAEGIRLYLNSANYIFDSLKAQYVKYLPNRFNGSENGGIRDVRAQLNSELIEDPASFLPRCGVGSCIEKAFQRSSFPRASIDDIMTFIIETGLMDPNDKVRAQIRKAGIQIVDTCGGGVNTMPFMTIFDEILERKPTKHGKDLIATDFQREGVVVFLGAIAKHLKKTDPRVSSIVDSLLDALSIPSESVQRSVANCLSPLIPAVKDRSTAILDSLLIRATEGQSFGERKGAAFGVSATVKGLGISSLKQHEIIPRLEEAMKKGNANARQGAMFVFECLGERLGMLFEPYIVVIVPIMLKCFADASLQVREASSHTSKVIMAKLSAHGVRLVLPTLLVSLDDNAWRTKQASIFILGSMAHCAPRQLGSCLPQVVPKLMQALTDSHPKVCEAGKLALKDIGSVVQNPEITSILKVLLNALEDPNKYATAALQQLQSMTFKHSIDAPSLALVMPIITRGLKDRTGDAKKKSALIVGSMCRMINDAKDLLPYMEMVLPNLKTLLMDPIPEIRTVSAKAMGKLVTGLGESHFIGILSWLMESLQGDFGSVERSGAAQGLCEVLVALGGDRVEKALFDEIFPIARHPKASVREGVLWIIAFLPPILGKSFAVFLHDALPIIVTGLSDEVDAVRDVAAHAGHVVVSTHAVSHAKEILPALVNGLFDDNWRIRQSSVALLGDLIHRIGGARAGILPASSSANDDEATMGGAAGDKAIIKLLGVSQRNSILASLYMIRSDASVSVRQNALQVWKSVVTNTPKVLRQILETLMNVIVKALSGDNVEKQTIAGRTLGEIVRKLGENVLPEIVPFLRSGLSGNQSSGMRHGACIGLAEIIDCSSKKQLEDFVSTLVGAIVDGVSDELPQVRASAAHAFVGLHNNIGYRAIDETIPCLLKVIKQDAVDGKDSALLGLQDILRVKSKEVIPYLIPRLLVAPLSKSALDSLAYTAKATGSVIHFQLERIFAVLFDQFVLESKGTSILNEKIKQTLGKVVLSVDASGVHWLIVEMCKHCEASDPQKRMLAFDLIREFCTATQTNYEDQIPLLLKQITVHLNDPVRDVVVASSGALSGLNVTVRPEVLMKRLDFIRHNINTVASDARHRKGGVGADGEFLLPGLCIPKGLDPFLPSYQYALMNGSPEQRQSAATGLGELVQISNSECLRPYLIKITGPLIRIAGDRFPGHVKAAILETLGIMIRKGGIALKPFLPQLQTTFIKALNDPAAEVRAHGTAALLELVSMSPRLDPLIIELSERVKTTEGNVREANMSALMSIVEQVHGKLSLATKTSMQQCLLELLGGNDDTFRMQVCNCLALCVGTDADEYLANSGKYMAPEQDPSCLSKEHKRNIALFWSFLLEQNPLLSEPRTLAISTFLSSLGQEEHEAVRSSAIRAAASLIKIQNSFLGPLIPLLVSAITNTNKEDNKISLRTIKRVAKKSSSITRAHLTELVEPIFSKIKGCNIAVKIPAERALLYVLEIPYRPETLSEYMQECGDPTSAKLIAEYARRVLAKLKLESDESE